MLRELAMAMAWSFKTEANTILANDEAFPGRGVKETVVVVC